jgi:prophage regulatory protein
LHSNKSLFCLDQEQSETTGRRQRDRARPRPYRPPESVLARTGLSRSTIYHKIAEGTFPAQIRISVNGAGWRESDINRWIDDPVAWRPREAFDLDDQRRGG